MAEQKEASVIPEMMANLEWVWVLTSAVTKSRDSILVVEMEDKADGVRRRIVPVFENREDAAALQPRLTEGRDRDYTPQAIRLGDVGVFAVRNELEIMLLDQAGTIVAHMEAKPASVH